MRHFIFLTFSLVLLFACKKEDPIYPVLKIRLNITKTTILIGGSEQLSVIELLPPEATEKGIIWSSDNTALATVDATGMVSVPATATEGVVNITITPKDGSSLTDTCVIAVVSALEIGHAYQGGIIAYIDETGMHGFIAAPTNLDKYLRGIAWGNSGIETGATGIEIGTGKSNTKKIVQALGAEDSAAKRCDDLVFNGYSDWFLPSRDELRALFRNDILGYGKPYWTSTDHDVNNAWYDMYFDYSWGIAYKGYTLEVCAIRYF